MLKNYELCALFPGDNTTEEIDNLAKEVAKLLEQAGSQIVFTYNYGRKKIAYKIKGAAAGEYRLWYFQADSEQISTGKDKLELAGLALRFLLVCLDQKNFEKMIGKMKELASGRPRKPLPPREAETDEVKSPAGPVESEESKNEKKKLSSEELDKKLEEILTDEKL